MVMENSRVSLQEWLFAIYLMTSEQKGLSCVQFAKEVGVTQKTAWFMEHCIRKAWIQKTRCWLVKWK